MPKFNISNDDMSDAYASIIQCEHAFYESGNLTTKNIGGQLITTLNEWVWNEYEEEEQKIPRAHYEVIFSGDGSGPGVLKIDESELPSNYELAPAILETTFYSGTE